MKMRACPVKSVLSSHYDVTYDTPEFPLKLQKHPSQCQSCRVECTYKPNTY